MQEQPMKEFVGKLLQEYETKKPWSGSILGIEFGERDHDAIVALRNLYLKLSDSFSLVDLIKLIRLCEPNIESDNKLVIDIFRKLKKYLDDKYKKLECPQDIKNDERGLNRYCFHSEFYYVSSLLCHEIFDNDIYIEMLCFNEADLKGNIRKLIEFNESYILNLKIFITVLSMPEFHDVFSDRLIKAICDPVLSKSINLFITKELNREAVSAIYSAMKNDKYSLDDNHTRGIQHYIHKQFALLSEHNILIPEVLIGLYSDHTEFSITDAKLKKIVELNQKYPVINDDYILELIKEGKLKLAEKYAKSMIFLKQNNIPSKLLADVLRGDKTNPRATAHLLLKLSQMKFDLNQPDLLSVIKRYSCYSKGLLASICAIEEICLKNKCENLNSYVEDLLFNKAKYANNLFTVLFDLINELDIETMERILKEPQKIFSIIPNKSKPYSFELSKHTNIPWQVKKDYSHIKDKTKLAFLATRNGNSIFSCLPKELVVKIVADTSVCLDSESSQNFAVGFFSELENQYKESDWEIEFAKYVLDPKFQLMVQNLLCNKIDGQISINGKLFDLSEHVYNILRFVLEHDESKIISLRNGYKAKLVELLNTPVDESIKKINLLGDEKEQLEDLFCGLTKMTTMIAAKYASQPTKDNMIFGVVATYVPAVNSEERIVPQPFRS